MNSRERVLTSFRHQIPDRVPLDFSGEPEVETSLIKHLQLQDHEALLHKLHIDFRHLDKWGNMVPKYVGPELPQYPDGTFEDFWGVRHRKVEYRQGCFYDEWIRPPLTNAISVQDVERHRWPHPDWYDFTDVAGYCKEHDQYCLVAGRGCTLDSVGFFRGMEQAMMDIYLNPGIIEAIIGHLFEFWYEYNVRILTAAQGRLDILFFSEDMGGQNGLLVGKKTLKKLVFPKLKKYAELAHKHNAMAMLHSDGDIHEIIPELIDIGIDIINPVQPDCPGMNPTDLKRKFGNKMCFHGLMDSQKTLPFGTSKEVVDEARKWVEQVGINGGLALAPNCGLQIDVPVENILAFYDGIGAT